MTFIITFANSLDPDQARQNIRPDLDSNCMTLMVFLKDFFVKINLKKKIHGKSMQKYPACKELKLILSKLCHIFSHEGVLCGCTFIFSIENMI